MLSRPRLPLLVVCVLVAGCLAEPEEAVEDSGSRFSSAEDVADGDENLGPDPSPRDEGAIGEPGTDEEPAAEKKTDEEPDNDREPDSPAPDAPRREPGDEPDDDEADPWPREGSFARYATHAASSSPAHSDWVETNLTLRYDGDAWEGRCEGRDGYDDRYAGTTEVEPVEESVDHEPARGPTDVRVGDVVDVPYFWGCERSTESVEVTGETTHEVEWDGDRRDIEVWRGEIREPWAAHVFLWEKDTGLVVSWERCIGPTGGCRDGRLVDTDALG